ncbi:unnamed protein product [Aureobasidium vineae]|uniref:RTA1-domain-containing protein n=1 Tax=Aureobasidium vineae TaxID=2773715 RepID=A0A9N8P930_9PEZI|nr:unnamed protein product [Aureobasidium vineae]
MSPPPYIPPCAPYGAYPSSYGYQPSLAAGVFFSVCFGLYTLSNVVQTFRTRCWWMGLFFSCGTILELVGWIGRTVAHSCSYSGEVNTMQIASLIMGPAYTQSGVYIALWMIVKILGREVLPVPPKLYLLVIFSVDCVCLSLQAIGGGLAGAAFDQGTSTSTGTTIMVVGIIAQLVSGMVFAGFLCIVFPRGASKIKANRSLLLACVAIVISTTMMNLRGFYRSIELCQGWRGPLITKQGYVIGLDAAPMLIAMGVLAVLNPSVLLRRAEKAQIVEESGSPLDVEKAVPERLDSDVEA